MTIEDVRPAPATEDTTATRWTTARADDQAARRALLMADLSECELKAEQAACDQPLKKATLWTSHLALLQYGQNRSSTAQPAHARLRIYLIRQHSLTPAMSFFGFDTALPPGGGDSLDERLRRMAEADENLWVMTISDHCLAHCSYAAFPPSERSTTGTMTPVCKA